ncbi:MAG: thymidine phosphorylase [Betaproteobacteria bacterium]|nr:thymidine phosphorylase [Betaproteobacteria bacterium]
MFEPGPAPAELIRIKRDGGVHDPEAIRAVVRGITDQSWADSQVGAWAMAVLLRGLNAQERRDLTLAMAQSGRVMDWRGAPGLRGPILDKHSTGGVGDKVSLIVAPLVAACGGVVPMISGRGLGHTGGTLDKLESLAGFGVHPTEAVLQACLREAGCAIIGTGPDLAPADRRLYAIRDVTATVESLDLITASILSKKLAAGLQALVMDVKVGSGAVMPELAGAQALARSLVEVAAAVGLPTRALITDMGQVLGRTAGHALEVQEALEVLAGTACEPRLLELCMLQAAHLLVMGGLQPNLDAARAVVRTALDSGAAAERFARMVALQGGPRDVLRDAQLPRAPHTVAVWPSGLRQGRVRSIDVRAVGLALLHIGGGRARPGDVIDPRVGLTGVLGVGEVFSADRPLAQLHAASAEQARKAAAQVAAAFDCVDEAVKVAVPPLVPAVLHPGQGQGEGNASAPS